MNKKLFLSLPLVLFLSCCAVSKTSSKINSSNSSSNEPRTSSSSGSSSSSSSSSGQNGSKKDEYDEQGRLILELKNVYFDQWDGSDTYTEELNEKFGVKIRPNSYDYYSWDEMVNVSINGGNLKDVIHFNLNSLNYGQSYLRWAKENVLKPLPTDLTKWPHIKQMLENTSNINALKVDGKLYCIPIANNIKNYSKVFSNFTYIYRRDWAKKIDELNAGNPSWEKVYKEGDVYTWEEFNRLLSAFKMNISTLSGSTHNNVMVDEIWGFPSVTNFYKDVSQCFSKDNSGRAINAFTSDKYVAGLDKTKEFVTNEWYSQDQFNFPTDRANDLYRGGRAAILYDNFSLENYFKIRKQMSKLGSYDVDDATAILKVKGPDGKYALEESENWFSATMFNYEISENKMNKILDIMDYLLSEEGTRLAIFGKENVDYHIEEGEVVLNEDAWEKDGDGKYAPKINGAKYLRYMVTLGGDTKSFDPYTDLQSFNLLNSWELAMKTAKDNNELRIVKEPSDIKWMSTQTKDERSASLFNDGRMLSFKYAFGKITKDAYLSSFGSNWNTVLNEINERLGF